MNKHLILAAAAVLALAGTVRAEEAAAAAEAKAEATPVAKMDKAGSLTAGKALLDEGKYAEAAAYFEGIGEQVADNGAKKREPWRLNNWALALVEAGQYDKAAEVAQKLVDLRPEMSSAWNSLASAQARGGKRAEAVATYEAGIAKLKELGADTSKLEANLAAVQQAIEDGKPKKVKEAEAKAKAEAEKAAAKAAEAAPAAAPAAK
jgi:NADH dehydrogenase [ubiquinone] 1 alpha subcomplex assembly factor 7